MSVDYDAWSLEEALEAVRMSVWTSNRLRSSGYRTVGEVRAASDADLLDIRNFGHKCLAEVRQKLGPQREPPEMVANFPGAGGVVGVSAQIRPYRTRPETERHYFAFVKSCGCGVGVVVERPQRQGDHPRVTSEVEAWAVFYPTRVERRFARANGVRAVRVDHATYLTSYRYHHNGGECDHQTNAGEMA